MPRGIKELTPEQLDSMSMGPVWPPRGHNDPPDMTVTAGETTKDLSGWMAENPVIQTEEQARAAKVYIDRGSLCVKDLEDERTGKVRPLNEQVKQINDHYRSPRELLERVVDELKSRIGSYLLGEERKRIAAAEEAARIAEQAALKAREAERAERATIDAANSGELGLDIADATANADQAFADYKKAEHKAAIAERETKVRIGGGFTRALSLRAKETLVVTDGLKAIMEVGITDDISDAILKSARAFRKLKGRLPNGVVAHEEREP